MNRIKNKYLQFFVTILIWSFITFLMILFGVIFGSNLVFRYLVIDLYDDHWLIVLQVATLSLSLLFISLTIYSRNVFLKYGIDPSLYLRTIILTVLSLTLIWIIHDQSPISSKYSWSDLPVPSENADESYGLVNQLLGSGEQGIDIDLSGVDIREAIENPLMFEQEIITLWEDIEPARVIINELNSYDQIADLSNVDDVIQHDVINIVYIARIYGAYAALMTEKSESEEAARQLAQLHSVIRKILPFSRFLINKCIWMAAANQNITNAKMISTYPGVHLATLRILKQGFSPLTDQEISCRTLFISELFFIINPHEVHGYNDFFEAICSSFILSESYDSKWNRLFLKFTTPIIIRKNTTRNFIVQLFDHIIEESDDHPLRFTKSKEFVSQYKKELDYGNIGGWVFNNYSIVDLVGYTENILNAKVRSDLLAIYLSEHLGVAYKIRDYFSGNDYVKSDSLYLYKSAGPDGILETGDDVQL
ncbi:MAG: hypothetical protein OEM02_07855 [Desulfobulbaceae bacterium]|nr:hypothetical protein [Desulfobulbaceae bacterium]